MNDLIERVKKECKDAYFAARHYNINTFGTTQEESDMLFYACFPNHIFSKFNPLLPKPLKALIKDPNNGLLKDSKKLYIFHYPLNFRKIGGKIKEISDYGSYYPKLIDQIPEYFKDFDVKEYMDNFSKNFSKGSCICTEFSGVGKRVDLDIPLLIGKREIIQEVMDYFKKNQNNVFEFFIELFDEREKEHMKFIKENTQSVYIYDLRKKPKELLFEL